MVLHGRADCPQISTTEASVLSGNCRPPEKLWFTPKRPIDIITIKRFDKPLWYLESGEEGSQRGQRRIRRARSGTN